MYKPHCSSWSVIDVFSVLSFQFDGVNWEIFAIASPIYLQYYSRAFFIITLPMYEMQQLQYLYNFDSLKPHFYIVKLGFTGVYIIFLIYLKIFIFC